MNFSPGLRSFYKLCSKKMGSIFGCPNWFSDTKLPFEHDTVSCNNLAAMILGQWLSQII